MAAGEGTKFGLTRRGVIGGATAVAGLGMAGCQAGGGGSAAADGGTSGFPVEIAHKLGRTTIPSPPRRIVAIGASNDLDAVVGLGGTLVGATRDVYNSSGVYPWLAGRVDPAKVKLFDTNAGIRVESIAAVRPDLILASGLWGLEKYYAQLSRIAPTVGFASEWGAQTWQEHVRVAGKAMGKAAPAEQLITKTTTAIAAIVKRHPNLAGKTFSLSFGNAPGGQVFTVSSPKDFAVKQMTALGLKVAPRLLSLGTDGGQPSLRVGPEQLDLLEADIVIIAYVSPAVRAGVERNPLFRSMPAVAQRRYFVTDADTISQLRAPSVLGLPWALGRIEPAFASASRS